MTGQIETEKIMKLFQVLLEETFEKVHGIYLDGGTSLFETLEKLTAAEASKLITKSGTSIASQIDHIRFYFEASYDYIDNKAGNSDWQGSWKRKVVDDQEWEQLRQQLADDYREIVTRLKNAQDWNNDSFLGGMFGIIVHTAYHLGAIRQIQRVAKK
jgi:hypothetical protein